MYMYMYMYMLVYTHTQLSPTFLVVEQSVVAHQDPVMMERGRSSAGMEH